MASFDIISATGNAYRLLWAERRYLMRLAAAPVFVKLVCHGTVEALGYETSFVRQALIMLPSFFFDGWMLSHVVRLILYGQRWPFRPGGANDMAVLQDRAQGIMTGAVAYALTRFLMLGLFALLYMSAGSPGLDGTPPATAARQEARPEMIVIALLAFAGLIWGFRMFWLFIPAAGNIDIAAFLKRIRGFGASLYMIGAWLSSFIPVLFLFIGVTSILAQPYVMPGGGLELPAALNVLFSVLWVFNDTIVELVTTLALTVGLRKYLLPERGTA